MKKVLLIATLLAAAGGLAGCVAICDEFGDLCVAYVPPVTVVEVVPARPVEIIEVVPVPPPSPCPGPWPFPDPPPHRHAHRYPWRRRY